MERGRVVVSPDGERWRVRRRWVDRGLPNLGKRFRAGRREAKDSGVLDDVYALDGLAGIGVAVIAVALAGILVVVLLPLLGVALELVLLLLIFGSGLFGRVVLRRPWTVERSTSTTATAPAPSPSRASPPPAAPPKN